MRMRRPWYLNENENENVWMRMWYLNGENGIEMVIDSLWC